MLTRALTGILLVAIFLPLFIIGGWATYLIVVVVGAMSMYELTSLRCSKWPSWVRYLLIVATIFICLSEQHFFIYEIFTLMSILFAISICNPNVTLEDVSLYTILCFFLGFAGQTILSLGTNDGMYLIYICAITFSVDTGAYFAGRFFGKHKLNERISPKKTIEGSIGGFLLGVIVSVGFSFFVPEITKWLHGAIVYGIGLSIFGQIGDLVFSLIKRTYDVKDYGSLLPGHGGVMDRIDSLLMNSCMFQVLTILLAMGII